MKLDREKYLALSKQVKKLGVSEDKIDELIENIDSLANILIDLYLEEKENEEASNNLL